MLGNELKKSLIDVFKINPALGLKLSRDTPRLTQELINNKQASTVQTHNGNDLFTEMKQRFLRFKNHKYLEGRRRKQEKEMFLL